jgi:hypothetical protein
MTAVCGTICQIAFSYEDFLYQKINTPLRVQCSWGSGTPVNKACRPARCGGEKHAHAATARCLPVRALGVRISVHRLLHPFCTTFSVLQLCAVSRARPDPPTRRRAPGPGMFGPGCCGCARFCAPGRSRRPAARRPPRTRPDPQSAGTGVPAFRPVFARSPRAVWSMLYTPAPAISPCASCASPAMQANCSKQKQQQPILGCFLLPVSTDVQH